MKRTLRYLSSWFLVAGCLLVVGDVGRAQAPRKIVNPRTGQTHWTGRKPLPPEALKRLADAAKQRHGNLIARLPKATAAVYDARVTGVIPPIRDQGQCGSCWDFSGSGMCTVAFIKAGQIPNSTNGCSEQYTLDCGQNGGCNGDDNVTVLQWCKATGLPLDKDYGVSYQASSGRCASTSILKLYKLQDYGFCTGGGNGVANTQDIKNAIVAYGCVGCGVAAGGGWWNSGTGTDTANGQDIDHDVIIIGWDDTHDNGDGSKGAWIVRNSWNTSWGDRCANAANPNPVEAGYGWMKYGADSIGTEAVWAVAASVKPLNPWVFGKRASLDHEPQYQTAACCGSQVEAKSHCGCYATPDFCACTPGRCQCYGGTDCHLAPNRATAPITYNATFTTTADRQPGSYGSALFGISANLPQMLPQGTYSAVLTRVGQQKAKSTGVAVLTIESDGGFPVTAYNVSDYGGKHTGILSMVSAPLAKGSYAVTFEPIFPTQAKATAQVIGKVAAISGTGVLIFVRLVQPDFGGYSMPRDLAITINGATAKAGDLLGWFPGREGTVRATLWPNVYNAVIKADFMSEQVKAACDCSITYRDPQTGRRWRYTTPHGDWDWLPEAMGTWCTGPDGSHFWSPSGQCPTIQPLPQVQTVAPWVPFGGGFSMMRGGGC